MAQDAIFRHGSPVAMIDHTAAADIAAGEVVLVGNLTGLTACIAHLAIANGAFGALAAGGGVYDCMVLAAYTKGTKVYWDDATNKITTTSTNNAPFGSMAEATTAANTVAEVLHTPWV